MILQYTTIPYTFSSFKDNHLLVHQNNEQSRIKIYISNNRNTTIHTKHPAYYYLKKKKTEIRRNFPPLNTFHLRAAVMEDKYAPID